MAENHWSAMICNSILYPTQEVMYAKYEVNGANSFGKKLPETNRSIRGQHSAENQWNMICNSVLYPTYEVMYTKSMGLILLEKTSENPSINQRPAFSRKSMEHDGMLIVSESHSLNISIHSCENHIFMYRIYSHIRRVFETPK